MGRAVTVGIVACCWAIPAWAGDTRVLVEASVDLGASWSSSVVASPGEEVAVRVRIQYLGAGSPIGFGGITHAPTLWPWDSSRNVVLPALAHLSPDALASLYGRVYPFNSVGLFPPPGLVPNYVTENGELRWATVRTSPQGTLPIGVHSAQAPLSLNATGFSENLDVVIFRYGNIPGGGAPRAMVVDVPLALINNARATWFTTSSGTDPLQIPLAHSDIIVAEIHVVPGLGGGCVIVGAALWSGMVRRRRPRAQDRIARKSKSCDRRHTSHAGPGWWVPSRRRPTPGIPASCSGPRWIAGGRGIAR